MAAAAARAAAAAAATAVAAWAAAAAAGSAARSAAATAADRAAAARPVAARPAATAAARLDPPPHAARLGGVGVGPRPHAAVGRRRLEVGARLRRHVPAADAADRHQQLHTDAHLEGVVARRRRRERRRGRRRRRQRRRRRRRARLAAQRKIAASCSRRRRRCRAASRASHSSPSRRTSPCSSCRRTQRRSPARRTGSTIACWSSSTRLPRRRTNRRLHSQARCAGADQRTIDAAHLGDRHCGCRSGRRKFALAGETLRDGPFRWTARARDSRSRLAVHGLHGSGGLRPAKIARRKAARRRQCTHAAL